MNYMRAITHSIKAWGGGLWNVLILTFYKPMASMN